MTPAEGRDYLRALAKRCATGTLGIGDLTTLCHTVLAYVPPGDAQAPEGWTVTAIIRDHVTVTPAGRGPGYTDLRTADARALACLILAACDRADADATARAAGGKGT